MKTKSWTRREIIQKIQEWHRLYGDIPSANEWNPGFSRRTGRLDRAVQFATGDWPHSHHVMARFGTWNEAIAAAGYKPHPAYGTSHSRSKSIYPNGRRTSNLFWTKELVIEKFLEWEKLHGSQPVPADWRKNKERDSHGHRLWPDISVVTRRFGSWTEGLQAAGMQPYRFRQKFKKKPPSPNHRSWSDEEIIALIRGWAEENRLPPSRYDWKGLPEYPTHDTVARHFGTWNNAIKSAGYIPFSQGTTKKAVSNLLPLPRQR